jgi:hypothetical protein
MPAKTTNKPMLCFWVALKSIYLSGRQFINLEALLRIPPDSRIKSTIKLTKMTMKMTVWLLCSKQIPKFPVLKITSSEKNSPWISHADQRKKESPFLIWTNFSKNLSKCPIAVSLSKFHKANNISRVQSSLTENKVLSKGISTYCKMLPNVKNFKDLSHYTWTSTMSLCRRWTFTSNLNQKATTKKAFCWWVQSKILKLTLLLISWESTKHAQT